MGDQFWQSDEVVGGDCESKDGGDFRPATELDLGKTCWGLDSAEDLLDALAASLADAVTGMVCRALVDGCLANLAGLGNTAVDGDMRRDLACAQAPDKGFHIIGRVGRQRDAPALGLAPVEHRKRRLTFGHPRRQGQFRINNNPLRFSTNAWPI